MLSQKELPHRRISHNAGKIISLLLILFAMAGLGFIPTRTYSANLAADTQGGALFSWGRNDYGQLGNGTANKSSVPVAVTLSAGVTSFSAIAVGGSHSLAIGNDGRGSTPGAIMALDNDEIPKSV
jgi:hypothetical protein